jgi:16S rRNA (guanine527-N7)-methyltransferase
VHFADCIAGCRIFSLFVQPKGFLDLGSGNGFPGIVFAILNPGLTIECVDSDERKIVFIKQFALRNGLRNLSASCIRIENLNSPVFQATAKGLGALGKIFSLLEANTNSGSVLFLFKGPEWESEMKELTAKQCSTWNISVIGTYELPQNASHVSESRVILRALRT